MLRIFALIVFIAIAIIAPVTAFSAATVALTILGKFVGLLIAAVFIIWATNHLIQAAIWTVGLWRKLWEKEESFMGNVVVLFFVTIAAIYLIIRTYYRNLKEAVRAKVRTLKGNKSAYDFGDGSVEEVSDKTKHEYK